MGRPIWTPAYIALGSNLNQPMQQLQRACVELMRLPATRLIARSSLYQSMPMGPQDQPPFVNAVVGLLTQLSADEVLQQLQAIERRMGRQTPALRWGPRVIDLDILLYGDLVSATPELQLPHPGMLLRNFVMTPLAEIASHLVVAKAQSAAMVMQRLGQQGLQRLTDIQL